MKAIKMFGLAALTALMSMAILGVTSAAAESTALCTVDPGTGATEVCPLESEEVNHVHEVSVGKGKLLSSVINVECTVLFLGDTKNASKEIETLANPLRIEGNFTYTNCNSGCVVSEENSPSVIQVLKEKHETAKVTGEGLVHVNCSGFIDCRYNGVGLVGVAKGPLLAAKNAEGKTINPNGEVTLSEQTTNKENGTLCPTTAKLDLTTTPLTATYITN